MGNLGQAWIYKCNTKNPDFNYGYSWIDPDNGFLRPRVRAVEDFGGEGWVRSPLSWQNFGKCRKGDLVFCHQTDRGGLVGVTVAASDGYPDPDGERLDKCSMIDIGPERVRFDRIVTIAAIRAGVGDLDAYRQGKSYSTFLPVEGRFVSRLLKLCHELNPDREDAIARLAGSRAKRERGGNDGRSDASAAATTVLDDPVRREMTIEAFERKAAWAAEARRVYGYRCMANGCHFRLRKADGSDFIEVHHLIPMCEGGGNGLRNLSVLCPNHHRAIHYGVADLRERLERDIRREQRDRLKAKGLVR